MCGIVGIFKIQNQNGETPQIDPALIRKMADRIIHRGPDDEGYFVRPYIALGNRRLSIIDLQGGKQPISTADRRFTIVFNGEIFNYRQLRQELAEKGFPFRTESDTEVVLAGFSKFGPSYLDRLDGMFAFLIYDAQTESLIAGRDAFGIKPLYLTRKGDTYYFSSEVKAFRAVLDRFDVNMDALHSYSTLGYVMGRDTMFANVERLAPGSCVKFSADGSREEMPFAERLLPQRLAMRSHLQIDVKKTLIEAVERSLVADVPVSLYLSGGIDSSLIAAIVSRDLNRKLTSFSISFPEEGDHDEAPVARRVADQLGHPHESINFRPEDLMDPQALISWLEEPIVDPPRLRFIG